MAGKGFEIAEGYLDINADVDGALKDLRSFFAEVEKGLDKAEKKFDKSGNEAGEAFADGAAEGAAKGTGKLIKGIEGRLRDSRGRFMKAGENAGTAFTHSVAASVSRGGKGKGLLSMLMPGGGGLKLFSGLMSGASKFFSMFAKGFGDAVTGGMEQAQNAFKTASGVFQQISSVAGGLGGIAQLAGMAALIPMILGLAGALLHLSAALFAVPAAIGVLLAVIAPLIVAFKGFGEAVGAGLSGDVDAFNEALKNLTPNARAVAKEFVALGPALKSIKKNVQDALFAPLIGAVRPLATTLLPMLNSGMTLVAGSLGKVIAGFLELLASNDIVEALGDVFESTARIVDRMGPSLINLFGSFIGIMEKGLPWVEKFFGVAADGIDKFSGWLGRIQADGTLESWLTRAWDVGTKLMTVFSELSKFSLTLLDSFGDEGADTLRGIGDALQRLNGFLATDDGQEALHNLGVLVHWAGNAFIFMIDSLGGAMLALNGLFAFVRGIGPFFSKLGSDIADIARSVGDWFVSVWNSITGFFSDVWGAITGFFSSVGDGAAAAGSWFSNLWSTILDGGRAALDWIIALPGKIGEFFTALPGMVWDAVLQSYDAVLFMIGYLAGTLLVFMTETVPNGIRDGWNWVVAYVEEGASRTWARISALPGQIWSAISSLGSMIGNVFRDGWNWAVAYVEEGASRTWARIRALPGQIWSAISSIAGYISRVFIDGFNQAVSAVSSGVSSVMSWLSGLPGKAKSALSGAGTWLVSAGKDMLRGLVNGLEDTLGWAVSQAKHAAQTIKDGFLSALDINSPSKVMAREVGVPMMQGIAKGMDDGMPDLTRYVNKVALGLVAAGHEGATQFNPTVNVGAPRVVVMVDGEEVAARIILDPAKVAALADEGRRQRSWVSSTGRLAGATLR